MVGGWVGAINIKDQLSPIEIETGTEFAKILLVKWGKIFFSKIERQYRLLNLGLLKPKFYLSNILLSKRKKCFFGAQRNSLINLYEISFSKIQIIFLAVHLRELFFFEITTYQLSKYAFI